MTKDKWFELVMKVWHSWYGVHRLIEPSNIREFITDTRHAMNELEQIQDVYEMENRKGKYEKNG